jgi:hypothetical protein
MVSLWAGAGVQAPPAGSGVEESGLVPYPKEYVHKGLFITMETKQKGKSVNLAIQNCRINLKPGRLQTKKH